MRRSRSTHSTIRRHGCRPRRWRRALGSARVPTPIADCAYWSERRSGCTGIAQRVIGGELWFLYRDAQGNRRALSPEDHDQAGLAALFSGAEGWLCRLWPASDGGWDHERAAEVLIRFCGMIGTVDAAALGFELPPEPLRDIAE